MGELMKEVTEPDWDFIETYMEEIFYRVKLQYDEMSHMEKEKHIVVSSEEI